MFLPAPYEILAADVQNYPPILDLFIIFSSRLVEIARDITLYVPPKRRSMWYLQEFSFYYLAKIPRSFRGQIY